MSFLVLKAYLKLIQLDLVLARGKFAELYDKVRSSPVGKIDTCSRCSGTHLFGRRRRLYLVLEGSALPAALGSDELPPQKPRDPRSNGNWGTTVAI